jgi:hypothetical protein
MFPFAAWACALGKQARVKKMGNVNEEDVKGADHEIALIGADCDKLLIRPIHRELRHRGYSIWYCDEDIAPGQVVKGETRRAIERADLVLLCLSRESASRAGDLHCAIRLALSAYERQPAGSIHLIPIKLDDCFVPNVSIRPDSISLRDIMAFEFWRDDSLDKLCASIDWTIRNKFRGP